MACHECDLLHRIDPLPAGTTACCSRCGAVLYRPKVNSLERSMAFAVAGLILFVIANTYPFLGFKLDTQIRETTLTTGVIELYHQGMWELASLVLLTCVLAPLTELLGMLYILIPLRHNRIPWKLPQTMRFLMFLKPWGMTEVFMLGILVSVVKLAKMATIVPGTALFAFLALIFILAAMTASFDAHLIWERLNADPA